MRFQNLILLVVFAGLLWACNPDDGTEKEIVASITSSVNAIAVDNQNNKWIGTDEGLFKAVDEGYEKITLSITGKISSLYFDKNKKKLWVGTASGLLFGEVSKGEFSENVVDKSNLSNSNVLSFYFDENSRNWFGSEVGLSMNSGDEWKKENFRVNANGKLFPMTVENFAVNSIAAWDGDYYFATSGAKLYRAYDYNEEVDAFSGATQWDYPYNGQCITDTMFVVFVDKDGIQWMGGKEGVQLHKGHDAKDMTNFMFFYDELPDHYVLSISQAENGDVWIGTRNGIGIYDGSEWKTVTDGLPDLKVNAIAFDEDGSAWVGTPKGIVHIN